MTKRVADSSHRGVDRQFTERAMEASSAAGDPVRLQPMDFAETVLRAAQKIADERRKPFPTPVELQSMSVSGLIAQAEVRELTNAQFQELDYYVGEAAVSNGLMNLGGQRYIREARKRLAKAYAKGSAGERSASNPTQIAKDLMTIHMKGARMRNYNASADSKTVSSHWDAQMGKAKTANLWANLMTDKDFQKHLTKKSIVSSGSTPIEWAVDDYHYGRSIDSPKNMKILQELDGLIAKGTRRQKNAAQATKTSILKTVGTKIDADNLVGRVEYWEDQSELIDAKITKLEAEEEKARKGKAPKNPKRLKVIRAISFLKGRIQDANGRMKLIKQSGRTRSAAKTIDDELKGYRRKILKEEKKLDELPPEAGNKPAERPKSKRTNVWIDPETGKKGSERAFLAAVSRDPRGRHRQVLKRVLTMALDMAKLEEAKRLGRAAREQGGATDAPEALSFSEKLEAAKAARDAARNGDALPPEEAPPAEEAPSPEGVWSVGNAFDPDPRDWMTRMVDRSRPRPPETDGMPAEGPLPIATLPPAPPAYPAQAAPVAQPDTPPGVSWGAAPPGEPKEAASLSDEVFNVIGTDSIGTLAQRREDHQ